MGQVKLRIREVAEGQGIKTPFALSRKTQLNYAICYRLWHEDSTRVSLKTLAVLCDTLGRQTNSLLRYTDEEESNKKKPRKRKR
jgi:DNA-binding Xre family transcriptional regulator